MNFRIITSIFLILLGTLMWPGCSKEIVEAGKNGNIKGQVQNSATGKGLAFASITTNPGTDAILTDEKGNFSFSNIPTGNYTVQAEKEDYGTKTVRLAVKERQTATAQILLSSEAGKPTNEFINAEVTSFSNTSRNDSSFAEVNYLVANNGSGELVNKFEVYFKIYTSQDVYYAEVKGDTLDNRQQHVGSFSTYIRHASADSVTISGIYAPDPGE